MGNRSVTKYKVVLVPFPFDDLSGTKVRPAVCLTEPIGQHRHVVLAFITSNVPDEPLDTDIVIASSDEDFELTGLRISSALRLHRMITANTQLIQRELGQLSSRQQEIIKDRLKVLFDLR
jgi:mRNA interferase MazF